MICREIVEKYYQLVDSKDFSTMYNLFSDNIIYNRAGKEIKGIPELKNFYEHERKLVGEHIINRIIEEGESIIVEGKFEGINGKGDNISVRFCDVFDLEHEKIVKRTTYINESFEIIE